MSKNAGGKKGKRKREHKVSKGIHGGGGKVPDLSAVQLVLLGKGQARSFKPIGSVKFG